jgi:prepilin-type N-terminal cleavage/methylation domain-containing protein
VTSPQRWQPGRGRPAFTLIEIVLVIAVLVILMVAGVSLIGGTGNAARKTAADTLAGMIEQARTAAITSRSYVVLAVAEPGDLPAGDSRCRIGLFKVKPEQWPQNISDPVPAVLMSRWRILENGVVLLGGEVDGLQNPLNTDELVINYGANGRSVKAHAIAFNPRGGLHHPVGSNPIAMRVAEGGYRNGIATPNRRADSQAIPENRLKIGRVTARPYRIDG